MGDLIEIKFNPHDIWVGIYWVNAKWLTVFICIIPMFPIRIDIGKRYGR